MKNKNSLITWGIIFIILVGSGLLTILLPAFLNSGATTPLPSETTTVTIPLPMPVGGRSEVTLPSWQLMLGLAALIFGLVIGAGLVLALIYTLLSRQVARNTENPDFQQQAAALQKRYDTQVAEMRQTRPTSVAPESTWQRWGVFTTAITILMFVAFGTFLFASMLFPDRLVIRDSSIINMTLALVMTAMIIALTAMGLWLRSGRLAAFNRTESMPIPWDLIAVVITGLLVVGLGIGVIAILNAPK